MGHFYVFMADHGLLKDCRHLSEFESMIEAMSLHRVSKTSALSFHLHHDRSRNIPNRVFVTD